MDVAQHASDVSNGRRVLSTLRQEALPLAIVFVILSLSLSLRLFGLNWDQGFPWTPHPDERAILMRVDALSPPALSELDILLDAEESPWNPRWFPYGSFPLYLLKGVELIYSVGPGNEIHDLRIVGRTISVLADVTTVMLVLVMGSRIYGRRVGVLASAFTALAVIHIQLSHFFAVDTLQSLFAVVALYFMYRIAREGKPRDSVLAGAFIGLGLATKVSQAPIYAAFAIAHLMYLFSMNGSSDAAASSFSQRWSASVRGIAFGVGVSLAVLFVAQPYAFLDWSTFLGDVFEQSEMVRRIRDYPYTRQYIDTTPYWYHVRQLATWGLGWPLGIVAWAGLLYVSLRGMRLKHGLSYLGLGLGLPIAILLVSTNFIAVFLASGLALLALLATLPVRSPESRMDVLLLSWVVPYFLITGSFQVKFMRYLIPITPFLILFGSRMLFALWDRASEFRPSLRPLLVIGLTLLVGSTAFYAISYTSIYRETHTAVRASEWINRNVAKGSVILKEHWEEGLPNMRGYEVRELPLYNNDSPAKIQLLANELARGDYLVFFSNRLYGTIPRLPERYPVSTQYYHLLFSGELGYELVNFEATYPELFGVGFVDDTFRRPGVPEPEALRTFQYSPLALNLGFADESFSVYDHPKVLILGNSAKYDAETLKQILQADFSFEASQTQGASPPTQSIGLMLSPEDAEAQRRGGTWLDIITPDSWTNRFPVLAWLIVIEGIAFLALPITFYVFRPLPDRGYLFSKMLGLLGVGMVVWLLASLKLMAFSRGSIALALLALSFVSALIIIRRRDELIAFVKERWSIILIGEIVFLAAFFAFLIVRMANPDLWHPVRGGEKPMELAYLNAVLRSSYMPPYDPWFGGGYLNYYYWGQFIVANLIRTTGINPGIAFNLAIPTFFALTAAGAFAVVYNLAEGTRRRLASRSVRPWSMEEPGTVVRQFPTRSRMLDNVGTHHEREIRNKTMPWSPVIAGVTGASFVAVLGNLDGAIQIFQGAWRALFLNSPFGAFDFWRSSRMMAPDPPGFEINEFPFFTFLFADLHAHMMVMPFTILVLGLALALVLGAAQKSRTGRNQGMDGIARLAVLGLAIGSLRLINAWDFPTYLLIGVASVFLAEFFAQGGVGLLMLVRAGAKSVFVFAIGYLAFLPYHLNYETFFSSVESTTNTTVLWQFLAIHGLFIFVISSFFVRESREWLLAARRFLANRLSDIASTVSSDGERPRPEAKLTSGVEWALVLILGALAIGFVITVVSLGFGGSTIPLVAILLVLVLAAGLKWLTSTRADAPHLAFLALIVVVPLSLAIGLDVFRVQNDIDRMNTVFKFYLQIWILLSLASAYLLWRLGHGKRVPIRKLATGKKVWVAALAVLIISASVYPIAGTRARLRDRFHSRDIPLTLNGTAYIQGTVYRDPKGDIDLEADFEGIEWLRNNVQGSPIVLEAVTPTYQWGNRISVYTGLPSVVGWKWHQEQQRWDYRREVGRRIQDVERLYGGTNVAEALRLMRRYGVKYIYVGQVERLYYSESGLDKFDGPLSDILEKTEVNDQVTIYRVKDGAL